MNRNEFMTKLQNTLGNISSPSKEEIMYDYREHFEIGLEQGKTEEEICGGLGDPKAIAKQYRVEYMVRQADTDKSAVNVMRAIFAALSLGVFNLIFMLPILAVVVSILAAFYCIAIACVFSGIAVLLAVILSPVMPQWISLPDLNPAILVFGAISLTSFGLLFTIVSVILTKLSYKLTISYIKTNMKIITKQESERENYV